MPGAFICVDPIFELWIFRCKHGFKFLILNNLFHLIGIISEKEKPDESGKLNSYSEWGQCLASVLRWSRPENPLNYSFRLKRIAVTSQY